MEITIDPPPDRGCGSAAILFSQAFEKIRLAGGGRLRIRDGEYLLGPLDLPGSLTLALDAGATLRFTDDFNAYPPVLTRWEGFECLAMHPLIFAQGARDIRIEGEGTIDGNGYAWWAAHRQKQGKSQAVKVLPADPSSPPSGGGGRETGFLRPPLIQLVECENVVVSGIRIRNSPFWTLHPVFSRRIEFQGLRIENPADAPNTDGIDIDSCEEVRIVDCLVDVGDDCIALKAGSGNQGVEIGRPTRNVTISGCTFRSGHGGVVVGSETAGGVENVAVSNCRFIGTDRGIRIKSRRGRGGLVQNLSFSNLVMDGALAPVTVNLYYKCGAEAWESSRLFSLREEPLTSLTPRVRNIRISNLAAVGCRASAGFVAGLPESRIRNLILENCHISMAAQGLAPVDQSEMCQGLPQTDSRGLRLRNADCLADNVEIEGGGIDVEEGARLFNRPPRP